METRIQVNNAIFVFIFTSSHDSFTQNIVVGYWYRNSTLLAIADNRDQFNSVVGLFR